MMTLDQITTLAEVIASQGVVISLIYVARQLRQNNRLMQMTAAQERVQREFSEVFMRGINGDIPH